MKPRTPEVNNVLSHGLDQKYGDLPANQCETCGFFSCVCAGRDRVALEAKIELLEESLRRMEQVVGWYRRWAASMGADTEGLEEQINVMLPPAALNVSEAPPAVQPSLPQTEDGQPQCGNEERQVFIGAFGARARELGRRVGVAQGSDDCESTRAEIEDAKGKMDKLLDLVRQIHPDIRILMIMEYQSEREAAYAASFGAGGAPKAEEIPW